MDWNAPTSSYSSHQASSAGCSFERDLADLLGHRCIDTSKIYTKIDLPRWKRRHCRGRRCDHEPTRDMDHDGQRVLGLSSQLGFQLKIEGEQLLRFAKFVDESGHDGPLTTEVALQWARLPENVSTLYQAKRLEVVRCFAKYLAIFEDRTEIPSTRLLGTGIDESSTHFSEAEYFRIIRSGEIAIPDEWNSTTNLSSPDWPSLFNRTTNI